MPISEQQLIKNIKAAMEKSINDRDRMRRYILSGKQHPVFKAVAKCAEFFDANYRWHANTLVMVLAITNNKPTAELIRRRTDLARQNLEKLEELVEVGDISEHQYMKYCEFYNDDLKDLL